MLYEHKFEYVPLSRNQGIGGRTYLSPTGKKLPSVTTILDKTSDKTHLVEWKKRIGEDKANQITRESADLGTLMHSHLENYIKGIERPQGNNYVRLMAAKMADTVISYGLSKVQKIYGLEAAISYPDLYAGTIDCVGLHENELAIIDFKTTIKPKKEKWLQNYYAQTTAYGLAHNATFGTNIKKCVIFMCSRNYEFQEFVIRDDLFQTHATEWALRVQKYYDKFSQDLEN